MRVSPRWGRQITAGGSYGQWPSPPPSNDSIKFGAQKMSLMKELSRVTDPGVSLDEEAINAY
jgi:hypothetical protein